MWASAPLPAPRIYTLHSFILDLCHAEPQPMSHDPLLRSGCHGQGIAMERILGQPLTS